MGSRRETVVMLLAGAGCSISALCLFPDAGKDGNDVMTENCSIECHCWPCIVCLPISVTFVRYKVFC